MQVEAERSDQRGVRIGYIRRKTTWMTSSLVLAQAMKSGAWQQCSHRHLVLQHATIAAILPPKLVVAVLESLHKQMVLDGATNRGLQVPDEGDVHERGLGASTTSESCSQQDVQKKWSTQRSTAFTLW